MKKPKAPARSTAAQSGKQSLKIYPTQYESNHVQNALAWFEEETAKASKAATTPPPAVEPVDEDAPRLLVLCMTPRSGSTALSAALAASKQLGAIPNATL